MCLMTSPSAGSAVDITTGETETAVTACTSATGVMCDDWVCISSVDWVDSEDRNAGTAFRIMQLDENWHRADVYIHLLHVTSSSR